RVLNRVLKSSQLAQVCEHVKAGGRVKLCGVWGSSAPLLGAAVGVARSATVLFVCTHLDDADAIADDIEVLTGREAELFPAWEADVDPFEAAAAALRPDHVSDEIVGERLRLLSLLSGGAGGGEVPQFIVAPIAALMQPVPNRQALGQAGLSLRTGGQTDPERLTQWLVDAGFDRVEQVDQQGEFARRGGIMDIFAPGTNQPVRIEFFGEAVESIRHFDLDTQRSTAEIDGYDLVATAAGVQTDPARTTHLLEYLPPEAVVCVVEPVEVASMAETFYRRLGPAAGVHRPEAVLEGMKRLATLEMWAFSPSKRGQDQRLEMGIRSLQRLETTTADALEELAQLGEDNDLWVYCENPAERDRFLEILSASQPNLAGRVQTGIGHLSRSFHWPAERLVVAGHHEIFHRYARPRRLRRVRAGRPIDSFVDLQEGDYVVHVAHGIARFEGLRQLEKAGRKEEYLTLRFADRALLHVPVTEIQLVQKYIGARRGHPTLSHLGGKGWSLRKQRVERAVSDLAAELLRVQAIRASSPGISYAGRSEWLGKFEQEFIYAETEDQLSAMGQIYGDMGEPRPMDRLLCGDVGYGKTELAMRAAFRVAETGKQVALLVPTTVLAAQHYRTFRERMADYPFVVEVISRFRSKVEQARIVEAAAGGRVDVLIGTHRLLSEDVRFADLGLVIIDEEQRFGVEHKERLKRMRATVDVLTMTATPIPRTLHMALLGLRDISNLTTPPLDRRAIHTEVCQEHDERIRAAILRELNRKGQVFFVHNRVFNIESVADHVRGIVPEARVAVAHGQMPERRLEDTMLRFVRGKTDVLVCTTIIESGLDIPTANTMFVHEADRFGLAQLHQLRGRIGRYKYRAYCYLLLPVRRSVTRTAAKRLKAVEEFSDLGAGFQIAMRDLEIRGAGNILGPEQSGHIAAVGYELYCQLLEQAVRKTRGEEVAPPPHCHVELAVEAYIPRSYISSSRQRMEVYRRMALCESPEDLAQLGRDLADAYGPIPPVVDDLLTVALIRVLAGRLGMDSIVLHPPDVVFSLGDAARAEAGLAGLAGTVRLVDERTAYWRPPPTYLEAPTLLTVLRRQLQEGAAKR
ncbi:MAG: hypothetical protein AMJ81_09060, partial [Phycisphaerae bacterium SM23_33]